MSTRYSYKANLLAGSFLIGGVVLAVVTSFVLADVNFTRKNEYIVRFSLADGATGLSSGSAVRVGGQQVGKVKDILIRADGEGVAVIDVVVSIRADIAMYEDAWAYLEIPLLGGASTLNLPYLGTGEHVEDPQGGSAELAPGEFLIGSIAPPLFLANAGFGPQQREQLKMVFSDVQLAMSELASALQKINPRVEPVADDIEAGVASARRTIEGIEADAEGWRGQVGSILANADKFSGRLEPMGDDVEIVLADTKELLKSGKAVVDDNRPRIDNILVTAEQTLVTVQEEWVPVGSEVLAAAKSGVDELGRASRTASELVAGQAPNVERTLANLRTASDQLKFLAIEARAQPWRLLHRPDNKELENQLLYDSARSYAAAVGDLRAASETLDALLQRAAAGGQIELASLQAMRDKVQQSFASYEEAEADLLQRMIEAGN